MEPFHSLSAEQFQRHRRCLARTHLQHLFRANMQFFAQCTSKRKLRRNDNKWRAVQKISKLECTYLMTQSERKSGLELWLEKHEKHAQVYHTSWAPSLALNEKHNFKKEIRGASLVRSTMAIISYSAFQRCQAAISSKWLTMKFRQQALFALRQFSLVQPQISRHLCQKS